MEQNIMPQSVTGGTGTLRVRTATAFDAVPVGNVRITVTSPGTADILYDLYTDEEGVLEDLSLDCPLRFLSLDVFSNAKPYAEYDLYAKKEGYNEAVIYNFQVFDGEKSLANMLLQPANLSNFARDATPKADITETPPHPLFVGGGGSAQEPLGNCVNTRILENVVIPKTVTVHLGKPAEYAQDVTVSFIDYAKNVASSEIYPTWPEQSLRANIHAQLGIILNRIYTEWYKSKGYDFDITNSTSYDQYYVHGRTIYESVSVIVDDIFNTYIRRVGLEDPYYAEYCDGKIAQCSGMKQWGTVTLAEQGYNALEILKSYYGNNIEIVRTNNIAEIEESYPGSALTIGSTGTNVKIIQRQLNRIAEDYPFFGTNTVDGIFGASTAETVKKFQDHFNLTADGIVGRSTWYKISYIYVAVKDLAELTSEGEEPSGELVEGEYPGTALQVGSSGNNVLQIQFWLNEIAEFSNTLQTISADGVYGPATKAAVEAFQTEYGLSVDGVVGQSTWDKIYSEYKEIVLDVTPGTSSPGEYPGTALRVGSSGDDVKRMQFYLRIVARSNTAVPDLAADGIFGAGTQRSVVAFQTYYGLSADGVVGKLTWDKLYEVYTDLINGLLAPTARPGTYPGTALRIGSTGTSVKEMQYYLYLLSAYYLPLPVIEYDGVFGQATQNAVEVWQELQGITVDGVVGPVTWNSIYSQFSKLRTIDGPVAGLKVFEYPGFTIQEGSQGEKVSFVQYMLSYIGYFFQNIITIPTIDGVFDTVTKNSVESFQTEFSLEVTGIVDEKTWNTMAIIFLTSASEALAVNDVPDGEYGGNVLLLGSTGLQVYRLQTYMDAIATRYCVADFVPLDGIFDAQTLKAVEEFQVNLVLPVTGFVDKITWDSIYEIYSNL